MTRTWTMMAAMCVAGVANAQEAPPPVDLTPPAPGPVTYQLDAAHSQLYVRTFKDTTTVGSGMVHDHAILATGWSGEVVWTPGSPATCAVRIDVPVSGLRDDPDALRTQLGLPLEISEGQREDITEHMLGEDQLWIDKFARIGFRSTSCQVEGDELVVTGPLTIRGESHVVTTHLSYEVDADGFSAKGGFKSAHTDFGFEPFTAVFGALRNANPLEFALDVKGKTR